MTEALSGLVPRVRLEEAGHIYYTVPGGARVPESVSSILRKIGAAEYGEAPAFLPHSREYYMARGTAIHAAVDLDVRGTLDESSVHPDIAPFLECWRRFKRDAGWTTFLSEFSVHSELWDYAGTIDNVGNLLDGGAPIIVDLKSGIPEEHYELQTAGYAVALGEQLPGARSFRRACLYLSKKNKARLDFHVKPSDLGHFSAMAASIQWVNQSRARRQKGKKAA